jgi:hypothetical protein
MPIPIIGSQDGGQAFPVPPANLYSNGDETLPGPGMSLRDFFVAAIVTGELHADLGDWDYREVARWAYDFADALIAERERRLSKGE